MKRTSNELYTPTESRRLVRGAGRAFHEYISKLRTEIFIKRVGCDGSRPLLRTDIDGCLAKPVHASEWGKKVVTR